jgi:hypothetical protein
MHKYDHFRLSDDQFYVEPSQTKLSAFGLRKGYNIEYIYDLGDCWVHALKTLDTNYVPQTPGLKRGCIAGARACPPEDCGGPYGYMYLLDILADPNHPEYEDRLEWLEEPLAPEAFDIETINRKLRRL